MTVDELFALRVPQEVANWVFRHTDYPEPVRSDVEVKVLIEDPDRYEPAWSTEEFNDIYLLRWGYAELRFSYRTNELVLKIAGGRKVCLPIDYHSCAGFDDLVALLRTMIRLHWRESMSGPLIEEYERDRR